MPSFDLLTIKPIEALSEAKPREVLNQTLARLQSSPEWVDEGAPRAAILRVIDPDFIHHAEHYDKLVKGGVRTDGTKFKGGGGIDEMVMDVGDATAGVTVKGSYEWDARPHTYVARVQFQNFKTISSLKEHTWTEKARLLLSDNIRIDCDCNAFRYFHRRAATTKGFALVAETRPSRVRNPLGKSGVCKHLEHVLRYVGGSYGRMASAMKKAAQRGGVNEGARMITLHDADLLSEQQGARLSAHAVVSALNKHGVEHTLIGGHAIGPLTGAPRATKDVDVVVGDVGKAHHAIATEFPHLVQRPNPGEDVTRYHDPALKDDTARGREVLNLLHPVGTFAYALKHTQPAKLPHVSGDAETRVPTIPAMLALKGSARMSPYRTSLGKKRDDGDAHALMQAHLDAGGDEHDVDYAVAQFPGKTAHISRYLRGVYRERKGSLKEESSGLFIGRVDEVKRPDGFHTLYRAQTHSGTDYDETKTKDFGIHSGSLKAAQARAKALGQGAEIHKVQVSVKNPFRMRDSGAWSSVDVATALHRAGKLRKKHVEAVGAIQDEAEARKRVTEHLEKAGYDGIVYRNGVEARGSTSYIALHGHQVKHLGTVGPHD